MKNTLLSIFTDYVFANNRSDECAISFDSPDPRNELQGVGHFMGVGFGSVKGRAFMCR